MTIIHIEMDPKEVAISTGYASEEIYDEESDTLKEKLEFCRNISFQGSPKYSGTYEAILITLKKDGAEIELPSEFRILLRESESVKETIGNLSFIESYSDEELGIREKDQFNAEIDCPTKQFDEFVKIVGMQSVGKLSVGLSIKAPKTDAFGHEAILEVEKKEIFTITQWPIEYLYINRTKKNK